MICFINSHASDGVSEVHDMQRHISAFVKAKFPSVMDELNNRRFHPSSKSVADHMYIANQRLIHSKDDQKNLHSKISQWKTEKANDKFLYCMKSEGENGKNFLFVYQSHYQQQLPKLYGMICLLDATYKSTKYALPLFFIIVKRNVDYKIVGAFVCEQETTDSIAEGLHVIASLKTDLNPSFFMTDFDQKEINAVERLFKDCRVYLCDFHRGGLAKVTMV